MIHIHLRGNGDSGGLGTGGDDDWSRWLARAVLAGFVLVELAACAWIIYKILSPKY